MTAVQTALFNIGLLLAGGLLLVLVLGLTDAAQQRATDRAQIRRRP